MKYKLVPEEELIKLEKARKDLYELLDKECDDYHFLAKLTNITSPMYWVANKKWREIDE